MILSEHVWKIGDWAQYGRDTRLLVWDVTDKGVKFIDANGCNTWFRHAESQSSDYRYLSDCDSWTWQLPATLQLKEGCWYLTDDGRTIGPCAPYSEDGDQNIKWKVGPYWYYDDGMTAALHLKIIREVPAPVPKYRPFKDDEAYEHCGKVLKGKNGHWGRALVVCVNDDDTIVIGDENVNYKYAFEYYTFLDGTPFGVKVDE